MLIQIEDVDGYHAYKCKGCGVVIVNRSKFPDEKIIQRHKCQPPSLIARGRSFLEERKRWHREKKPTRTDEEVEQLYKKFCENCEYRSGKICSICGCFLRLKLKWRTTSCPLNPPKWKSDINVEDIEPKPKLKNRKKPKKRKGGCGCSK